MEAPARKALRNAVVGALWGLGFAGLLAPRGGAAPMLGALLGSALAFLRPALPALSHPLAAGLAAAAGLLMSVWPEPTFFLLVPLLAAAVAWPVGPSDDRPSAVPRGALLASAAVAAAVFFVQSARRHWQFGSGSDLALFTQQHWLIAFGHSPYNTLMDMHMLADHATFVDFLVAPVFRLYAGAETLLLVQALVVASAVFPLFGLAERLIGSARPALLLSWVWLLSYEVHMGVMFDYNQSTLGAALLAWTAWALVCRGPAAVLVTSLLTVACKTNFPPYVAVLALVLALLRVIPRRRAIAVALLALVVFVVDVKVVVPFFRTEGLRHWRYEDLGETPAEIAAGALHHPGRVASLLVDQPEKRRSLLLPLANVGFLGLAEPASLLLQLPNWAERFLSTHPIRWWGYYYGMPATTSAMVGLLLGWRRLRRVGRASAALPRYVLACATLAAVFPPYRTPGGNPRSDLLVLRQPYASDPENVATQRAAVAFVGRDPGLRVAAQYHLLPHLATRVFIVPLDRAPEADVVVLQIGGGTHPGRRPAWRRQMREVLSTGAFRVAFCAERSVVLRRGPGADVTCPAWEAERAALEAAPDPS